MCGYSNRNERRTQADFIFDLPFRLIQSATMETQLYEIYNRLLARFGPQHWWSHRAGAFEIVVGAILTQNTAWTNVDQALANLRRARWLSPQALQRMPEKKLAALIRPSGYFNLKAKRLKAFARFLFAEHHGTLAHLFDQDTARLREELLNVDGSGPETADAIILYAAHQPIFVVDACTRRIFARLGLVNADVTYAALQALFMRRLPHDAPMFNEYHALIVALGKDVCKKSQPRCEDCPLEEMCETGRNVKRQA